MLLFAGLGNPGAQHQGNRHNVGFMAADAIHRRHGFSSWTKKFQGLIAEGEIDGEKVLLLKPQTFMNLSGQSVGAAMQFYKLPVSSLSVIYDELDLVPGKVRVKIGGGSGGHNGIKSIDAHVARDYRRIRIGIGHPGIKELVHGHVLGDFAKSDKVWLDPLLDGIADAVPMLTKGDDNGFMNKVTLAVSGGPAGGGSSSGSTGSGSPERASQTKPKAQSHIREARTQVPAIKLPETGPMAAMLRKLLGKKD